MITPIHPKPPKHLMPHDVNANGPQNENEQRLLDLVNEAIASGPSVEIDIDAFIDDLQTRLKNKRK